MPFKRRAHHEFKKHWKEYPSAPRGTTLDARRVGHGSGYALIFCLVSRFFIKSMTCNILSVAMASIRFYLLLGLLAPILAHALG
jgi:hypothetical protein